jgi:hypothetical protein
LAFYTALAQPLLNLLTEEIGGGELIHPLEVGVKPGDADQPHHLTRIDPYINFRRGARLWGRRSFPTGFVHWRIGVPRRGVGGLLAHLDRDRVFIRPIYIGIADFDQGVLNGADAGVEIRAGGRYSEHTVAIQTHTGTANASARFPIPRPRRREGKVQHPVCQLRLCWHRQMDGPDQQQAQ